MSLTAFRRHRLLNTAAAAVAGLSLAGASVTPALAQSSGAPAAVVDAEDQPRGPETLTAAQQANRRPPPLGAELFTGEIATYGAEIVDPTYRLKPGDRVRVSLIGLVQPDGSPATAEQGGELTIDPQGNIVLPGVGPVQLAGVAASDVQGVVAAAARQVYAAGVEVYAAALSSAPLQIGVTGPVRRPGVYPGASNESLVTLLQRAGGIDPNRGSYRRIVIVRDGQAVAEADLYDFLRAGTLPDIDFQNGDAVVVQEQGEIVSVEGAVRAPFTFEVDRGGSTGAEIIALARPRPDATHVALVGVRDGRAYSTYMPISAFNTVPVRDGDRVRFERDLRAEQVVVRVEGAHLGPSVYTVPRATTVGAVLAQVPLDPLADRSSIHLRRESVRATQRQMLHESLDRLERTVLTAPMRTPSEASARAQEAEFVLRFIDRARRVEPDGVLTLAGNDLNQVLLEPNDVIVIPEYSQVVTISGEVQTPQSLIHDGMRLSTYLRAAGGYTSRADRRNVLVIRPDGGLREDGSVHPGDRILVPAKPDSKVFQLVKDITQILSQIAIAAKVTIDIADDDNP